MKALLYFIFAIFPIAIFAQFPSQSCQDDLFPKQAENKFWGYVDLFEDWRVEPVFTKVYPFSGNKGVVEKYGRYGVANCDGKLIIPAEYDEIGPLTFSKNFWAKKGGKWSLVNEKGEHTAPGNVVEIKEVGLNSEATWLKLDEELYGLYDKKAMRFMAAPRYTMFQVLSEKASVIQYKEKFGIVSNENGSYLFEPIITSLKKLSPQVIIFQEKGKWGILNPYGEVKKVAEMDSIGFILNNLYYASKNGKAGLIDAIGKEVLPLEYEEVNPFYEHMSLIKKNGFYGYTTLGGRVTVPTTYEWGDIFQQGQAIVKSNTGYFIVDKNNAKVTKHTYKWLVKTPTRSYYAANRDGKYLFLDLTGKEMMEPRFALVVATDTNQFVRVQNDTTKLWSYFDITKNTNSFPGSFEEVSLFKYGYAFVQKNGAWGAIDQKGSQILPFRYDKITYLAAGNEVFFVVESKGKKGLISSKGNEVLPAEYSLITSALPNMLKVKLEDKYLLLNIDGKPISKAKYEFISNRIETPYTPEWPSIIVYKKKFGLLGQNNFELLKTDYENISFLGDNLYLTQQKGKKGIVDVSGKVLAGNYLEEIKPQSEKYLPCKKDGKWGYLFNTGKMMITPSYDEAGDFYKNLAVVKLDGKYGVINKQGKMVLKNEFTEVHNLAQNRRKLISPTRTIEITDKGIIKQLD